MARRNNSSNTLSIILKRDLKKSHFMTAQVLFLVSGNFFCLIKRIIFPCFQQAWSKEKKAHVRKYFYRNIPMPKHKSFQLFCLIKHSTICVLQKSTSNSHTKLFRIEITERITHKRKATTKFVWIFPLFHTFSFTHGKYQLILKDWKVALCVHDGILYVGCVFSNDLGGETFYTQFYILSYFLYLCWIMRLSSCSTKK